MSKMPVANVIELHSVCRNNSIKQTKMVTNHIHGLAKRYLEMRQTLTTKSQLFQKREVCPRSGQRGPEAAKDELWARWTQTLILAPFTGWCD